MTMLMTMMMMMTMMKGEDEDDDWEVNKEASLRSDNPLVVCLLIWLMV